MTYLCRGLGTSSWRRHFYDTCLHFYIFLFLYPFLHIDSSAFDIRRVDLLKLTTIWKFICCLLFLFLKLSLYRHLVPISVCMYLSNWNWRQELIKQLRTGPFGEKLFDLIWKPKNKLMLLGRSYSTSKGLCPAKKSRSCIAVVTTWYSSASPNCLPSSAAANYLEYSLEL